MTYSALQIRLLYEGYSSIQRLPATQRETLLDELQDIAQQQFNSQVKRNVTTVLYLSLRP